MKQWHAELKEDNSASFEIPIATGSKRKAVGCLLCVVGHCA